MMSHLIWIFSVCKSTVSIKGALRAINLGHCLLSSLVTDDHGSSWSQVDLEQVVHLCLTCSKCF